MNNINIYFPSGKLGHKEIGEFINAELGRLIRLRDNAVGVSPIFDEKGNMNNLEINISEGENKDYELYEMYASKYNKLKELRMQLLGY